MVIFLNTIPPMVFGENQSIDLGELANLSLVDAAAGNILKYNGASWVDGSLTIEEMTNVIPLM